LIGKTDRPISKSVSASDTANHQVNRTGDTGVVLGRVSTKSCRRDAAGYQVVEAVGKLKNVVRCGKFS
jgi:hypothetical protein